MFEEVYADPGTMILKVSQVIPLILSLMKFSTTTAATAHVIGWPKATLPDPEGTVITGITVKYDEPDFLGVNKSVDAYLGVRYAEPPVGALRFQDPNPYAYRGNYNATEDQDMCLQMMVLDYLTDLPGNPIEGRDMGEDCLFLSIYTPSPKVSKNVRAPVMVWIHGGGYLIGSGSSHSYDGVPLVAMSDIIVVAVNYRLGVFGFLTTGDDVAPGNMGMKDQIMALKWVQENIEAFGGDPGRVTIAGQSAGGASVSLHMLSPLSEGLFHRAIMQSGNAICPFAWSPMDVCVEDAHEFAASLNCTTHSSRLMLKCLQEVNADVLLQEQRYGSGYFAKPVVDGHFLPDNPIEMVKRHRFQNLPTLIGTNEDEGSNNAMYQFFPGSLFSKPSMNISEFRSILPRNLWYAKDPVEVTAVEQWYVDWSIADNETADQFDALIRLGTDQAFACPTEYLVRGLQSAGVEVYRYEMTHDPSWSLFGGVPKWMGAAHGEDIQYVFAWDLNPSFERVVGQTDEEKFMSIEFMRYWSNFVKSGNPNEPIGSRDYPEWPKYTMPDQEYKQLSLNMTNGRAMRASSCSFWLNHWPDLHYLAAPPDELYSDWQDQYARWRDTDMNDWTSEFEKYKENQCPDASP
ncbi:cholinesterase 1-like [Strongylocentrotus purpuratus]|uniref:Carboxylic ester hydrolase n=1 Tax=Strongylocentrotus purpuratus TaxID=7668 RepID=A0A7M7N717_STRPU|nr:cholinesterase 1-like [Strongylocentrotus purpuratus]